MMTMKNDEKSEEELTCRFKIDIRNLTNFEFRAWKVSKIYTFMGCFWPKYTKCDAKSEGKLTWGLEDDKRLWAVERKVSKLGLSLGPFIQSRKYMCLKFTGEFCVIAMKNDAKLQKGINLSVQDWHEEFDEFWLEGSKISKMFTLMGCFWPKYIMFELKKHTEVMFDGTEYWCKIWRKSNLCFQKWYDEFSKFSPQQVRKSKNWDFDVILLFKVENVWA